MRPVIAPEHRRLYGVFREDVRDHGIDGGRGVLDHGFGEPRLGDALPHELLFSRVDHVDGALVGGASLDAAEFWAIYQAGLAA